MNKSYKIEKLDHFGRGIINIDGKTIFVENAYIGDEVCVEIIKQKKNFSIARVKEYVKYSDLRKKDYCKYSCGGCDILELLYKEQLKFKEDKVQDILKRYLKEDIKVNKIIYDKDLNYRNKITLHVKNNKIGLYKKESNEIVEISNCSLVDDKINKLIDRLRLFISKNPNNISEIIIKTTYYNEAMIIFNGEIANKLVLKEFNDIESIFINDLCLKNRFIKDRIGEYDFYLSKDSFFQVNKFNTVNLYNEVKRLIKERHINDVLDLYCGVGTIGIYISKYVKNVIGVEVVEDAICSAYENKKLNNINNIEFRCCKVEDCINEFKDIDLIIIDPPRSGLSKSVINSIVTINPRYIIYVSCDIMTMVRDLNLLNDNYQINEFTPVDMFPNTSHCESVCILERDKYERI